MQNATERNTERIKKIKAEMGRNDDTTQDVANALGISRVALSARLNDKASFTIRDLEALAERYGKDYNYFF